MRDPVQVEKFFQELIEQYDQSPSIRYKYKLFSIFAEYLEGEYKKYNSYLLQLTADLPLYESALTWFGTDPKEIEYFIHLLTESSSETEDIDENSHVYKVIHRAREVAVLSFCCLNDIQSTLKHLGSVIDCELTFIRYIQDKETQLKSDLLSHLADYLDVLLESGSLTAQNGKKTAIRLRKDIEQLQSHERGSVYVPVIERYEDGKGDTKEFGRLRRISVEIYGKSEERDQLKRNYDIYGAEKSLLIADENLINAARYEAEKKHSKLKDRYYKGMVSYQMNGAFHEGDSANLAISALWFSSLLKQFNTREKYWINPAVIISGNIASDGHVLDVEMDSILYKTRAAFFSTGQFLIVPEKQKQSFIKELENLTKCYPKKHLEIIGVRKFEELLFDRRIVLHSRKNILSFYSGRLWNERSQYIAWFAIIAITVLLLINVIGPIDKSPATYHFQGTHLILSNSNGVEVGRIAVDSETVNYQNQGSNIIRNPLVALYDVTGDRINDVIWATRGDAGAGRASVVTAYSLRNESIIWEYELKQNYLFPRISADLSSGLSTYEIGIIEVNEMDVRLIVNSASQMYFPGLISSINIFTGEVLSEYLHIGMLPDMMLIDLSNNGVEEIVLLGVNNAFWNASIAVLDVQNMHGHSPLTEDYRPEGIERASEVAYILVPKTVIGEYTQAIEKFNFGESIYYDERSERFWFQINEGRRVFRDITTDLFILLYLDRTLKPTGVGTSNLYDIIARELFEEGAIPFIPDYEYFKSFQDSLMYWDGEKFVSLGEFIIE